MAYTTLYDFEQDLLTFLQNHAQLETVHYGFGYSDISNPKDGSEVTYPYCFLNVLPFSATRRQLLVPVQAIFMTQCPDVEDDILKTQSDMMEIARDVMGQYMIQNGDSGNYSLQKDGQFSITPFVERFKDTVAGVACVFNFEVDTPISKCFIPTRN